MRHDEHGTTDESPILLYSEKISNIISVSAEHGIDARFVGSIGRMASVGADPENLESEYGGYKDIDLALLGAGPADFNNFINPSLVSDNNPIPVEEHFAGQIQVGADSATIRYKGLVLPVDPVVFSPYTGHIFGLEVPTFNPNTLFHLTALYGFMRPKDFRTLRDFRLMMSDRTDLLPEDLFEPFHELNRLRVKKYPKDQSLGHLRWLYHTKVPVSSRKAISGITEAVWHKLK